MTYRTHTTVFPTAPLLHHIYALCRLLKIHTRWQFGIFIHLNLCKQINHWEFEGIFCTTHTKSRTRFVLFALKQSYAGGFDCLRWARDLISGRHVHEYHHWATIGVETGRDVYIRSPRWDRRHGDRPFHKSYFRVVFWLVVYFSTLALPPLLLFGTPMCKKNKIFIWAALLADNVYVYDNPKALTVTLSQHGKQL